MRRWAIPFAKSAPANGAILGHAPPGRPGAHRSLLLPKTGYKGLKATREFPAKGNLCFGPKGAGHRGSGSMIETPQKTIPKRDKTMKPELKCLAIRQVVCLGVGLVTAGGVDAASLTWLGTFGGSQSRGAGVSANGSMAAGWANNASENPRAFRWSAQSGMQDLGLLSGGNFSQAAAISADGATVVGVANSSAGLRAFRWTQATGMQNLGTLGGNESQASGVSANGAVIVGMAQLTNASQRPFRWTATNGMQSLGTLGGTDGSANAVSADGLVVVGQADIASGDSRAFRWTQSGGMQNLGTLGGSASVAYGASTNGSVVVGSAYDWQDNPRAFRWTPTNGMQGLGTLGGAESYALAVSGDGSVVVGYSQDNSSSARAFRWTAATGMQDLNVLYAALLPNGSLLTSADAISSDGRFIVGLGFNAISGRGEAYLLDVSEPPAPFRITSIERLSPGNVKVTFDSVPGKTYLLESRDQINSGPWTSNAVGTATGSSTSLTNTGIPPGVTQRFYRVGGVP